MAYGVPERNNRGVGEILQEPQLRARRDFLRATNGPRSVNEPGSPTFPDIVRQRQRRDLTQRALLERNARYIVRPV